MTAVEFANDFNTRARDPEKNYSEWFLMVDGHEVKSAIVLGDSVIGLVEQHPDYNRTTYVVKLLFGEWPDDKSLGQLYGAEPYCGGSRVTLRDDGLKHILVFGCD